MSGQRGMAAHQREIVMSALAEAKPAMIAGIEVLCDGCQKPIPLPVNQFYWTARQGYELRPAYCSKCAMQYEAPMIKPQPKGTTVDGWDV